MAVESFSPSVMIDGEAVTPPGWMWVLGFALRGVPWAFEEASKPGFRAQIDRYLVEKERHGKRREIENLRKAIARMQERIDELGSDLA